MARKFKKKYYTVWLGNSTGVFESWDECKKAIDGYKGAKYKSFLSKEEAINALNSDYKNYYGKPKGQFDLDLLPDNNKPINPSISVDAACSGNPGKVEFRGVETYSKAEVFNHGPYDEGTVNIGEFLAIVSALAYLNKGPEPCDWPIYSDSKTAIAWVKNKKANTKLIKTKKNEKLFNIIKRAELWLQNNTFDNKIIKWDTVNWGEIPADFNRK
ncbi:MAG: viroplasmin family protein [Bacteroidales bacterium]|jgi:ribonuclease HI